MKKAFTIIIASVLLFTLCACSDITIGGTAQTPQTESPGAEAESTKLSVDLSQGGYTVTKPGTYTFSGTLDNGQITVDLSAKGGDVVLVLDSVSIKNESGPAINILQAKNVYLRLPDGSTSSVISGVEGAAVPADEAVQAAIFSEDDLIIEGSGSLTVRGYINNGITCKDDLEIRGGALDVLAANNGIKGAESVTVSGGALIVLAGNDGIKSSSSTKEGKGYVTVSGGSVAIDSQGDGISAETELTVSGGAISIVTRGDPTLMSAKGLKAETALTVSGGTLDIESRDHALRSNGTLLVSDGSITMVSAAKGLASRGGMSLSGGTLAITSEDDGIESKTDLTLSGGSVSVRAGKDGVTAGVSGTGFSSSQGNILISGGELFVTAQDDGIDAKTALIVSGGTVLSLGHSKTDKGFSSDSSQHYIALRVGEGKAGNVTVSGEKTSLELEAAYPFNYVLCSAPEMDGGEVFTVLGSGVSSETAAK